MDTLLKNKDHATDGRGYLKRIDGREQKIQQAMIALSVPKGQFALDPMFGSLLHTLGQASENQILAKAYSYVQQALADIKEISLVSVQCKPVQDGVLELQLTLDIEGEQSKVSLAVQA